MTRLYLIRHAEAEGNIYRMAHGHHNGLITNDRGYQQIDALRERFRDIPIDAVYASDLYRTQITARAIWLPKALPLHLEPSFREIRLGVWEDQTWQELRNRYPEEMDHFSSRLDLWRAEGAETAQQLVDRFIPALRRVAEAHDGGTVAVFSHGAALRIVLGVLQGLSLAEVGTKPHGDNTAVSLLTWENGTFRVEYRDDNSHLAERGLSTFAKQTWWQEERMKEQGEEYRPLPETERGRFGVPAGDEATGIWYGDALIGAFSFRREADGLRLTRYILAPEWRGRRLGVPPMGQVLRYCRHQALPWLRLTCADPALRLFFARLGFVAAEGDEMVKDARCVLPPLPAAYMR